MRVLLVSANTERVNMPTLPLGLALVAAATRAAGHETAFLDLQAEPDSGAAIARACAGFGPEVIGVSVRNVDDQVMERPRFLLARAREVMTACRAASVSPIVVGGAGLSIFAGAAVRYLGADYGILGEGEVAFVELLRRLETGGDVGGVPGVLVASTGASRPPALEPDLDALPDPDLALLAAADPADPTLWVPVQARRGCPLDCTYCATAAIEGRQVRFRSPRRVAAVAAALAGAGFTQLQLVDNTFNLPPSYALALCRELGRLGLALRWRCIVYPTRISEALAAALAAAGCVEASVGFESGSDRVLRSLGKRYGADDVRHTCDVLARHGIRRFGFLLLGVPSETRESVEESLAFSDSLRLDGVKVTVGVRVYPGTALARQAAERGLVAADDDLLAPRFYLEPALDGWLQERVAAWERGRGGTS